MTQPIRLGDLLLRAGVINEVQLNSALAEQKKWGGKLGTILVRMGSLSEDLLVKALSKQLGIPRANLDAIAVPAQLLQRIDRSVCEKYGVVPLQYVQERRALMMAVSDPFNVVAMDDLSRRVGLRIEPFLAGEQQIGAATARLYGGTNTFDAGTGTDVSLKMVDNAGNTLVKGRSQLEAEQRARAAMSAPPAAAQEQSATSPPAPSAGAEELDKLARKQVKALRAILELLIEKRVLTREEYLAYLNQR